MKKVILLTFLFSMMSSLYAQEQTSYLLTNTVEIRKSGKDDVNRLYMLMAVPQTNLYQTVLKVTYERGSMIDEKHYGNRLLRLDLDALPGNPFKFFMNIYVNPHAVTTDFMEIADPKPYNPESDACKNHLGNITNIVDTANVEVKAIGEQLWPASSDVIEYARRCYEYVAAHLEYDELDDWHSLSRILKKGKGGSADFATLVINLLRQRGIPARHNVCVTLSQEYHTFADFYVEGFGWIPVDAAMKNQDPLGDYFGKTDGSCVVLSQGIGFDINVWRPEPITVLPSYYLYYTTTGDDCKISAIQYLTNQGITGIHPVRTAPTDSVNEGRYNLQGQPVTDTYKGIVISGGRKYLQK